MADYPPDLIHHADQEMAELREYIYKAVKEIQYLWRTEPEMDNLNTLIGICIAILSNPGNDLEGVANLAAMAIIMLAEERPQKG